MQKIVVPFGIVGILIVCWVVGVIRAIPADYSEKIAEYEKFAEEQVDLQAYGSGIEYYHKILKLDSSPAYYKRLVEIYDMADRSSEALCLEGYEYRRQKDNIAEDMFVHIDIPLTLEHNIELIKNAGFKSVDVLNQNKGTVIIKATK